MTVSRIAVVGLGYVGITTAVGMGRLGHEVMGFDIDDLKVDGLAAGKSPIFEAGIEEALATLLSGKTLAFTNQLVELEKFEPEFIFVCVATPKDETGAADLGTLMAVTTQLAQIAPKDSILVTKSTVPVGTGRKLSEKFEKGKFFIASNPEFLREGTALKDFLEPDRVVVGANSVGVANRVLGLYEGVQAPKLPTNLETSELIKYAANAYLAMRLSFTNDIAELTERVNANVADVFSGLGLDSRIGTSFFRPGPGWGGSCFPKDTNALLAIANQFGTALPLIEAAITSNKAAMLRIVDKIEKLLGGNLVDKTVAVWGIAFKANTDDIRDSPAVFVINELIERGASVRAYDPVAKLEERNGLKIFASKVEAARDSDLMTVLTEWDEFAKSSPLELRDVMKSVVVFDARRILSDSWRSEAARFQAIGDSWN